MFYLLLFPFIEPADFKEISECWASDDIKNNGKLWIDFYKIPVHHWLPKMLQNISLSS